jgi:capsular exopolysaccharide synthesis family protein
MNTYVGIASSTPILEELRGRLELGPDEPSSIEVKAIPDTELLRITVEDSDPILAQNAANAMAEILLEERSIKDIRVYVIEPATMPEPPSMLKNFLYGAMALVVGILGGAGLAFLFEYLDTRIYTTEQAVALTGLPVLGEIPIKKRRDKAKYLVDNPLHGDAFRRLLTNFFSISHDSPIKTLLITSAEPSEGKSTIVANLARSIAVTGRRSTLIIDADLHIPTMHNLFDLPNKSGLSSVLEKNEPLSDAILDTQFPGIQVLTSGPPHPHPAELLGSDQMTELFDELKKRDDLVLINTPAFLGVVDTAVLASAVDAVMLVIRLGKVNEQALRSTLQQLEQVHAKTIGIILNQVKRTIPLDYRRYYQQVKPEQILSQAQTTTDQHTLTIEPEKHDQVKLDTRIGKVIKQAIQSTFQQLELVRVKTRHSKDNQQKEPLPKESPDEIVQSEEKTIEQPLPTADIATEIPQFSTQEKDKFSKITGIGTTYEELLYAVGVMTFAQLAEQDPEDLEYWIAGTLTSERIRQQRWIEQAKALSSLGGNDRS